MTDIETSTLIFAPAEVVWSILIDFPAYTAWNPFIREVIGEPVVGTRLTVRIEMPGRRPMTYRPVLTIVDPPHELRWTGRSRVPGTFAGEHGFVIEAEGPERCRFRQTESFSGLVVPLFARSRLFEATRQGFAAMNRALQRRAETLPRPQTKPPAPA